MTEKLDLPALTLIFSVDDPEADWMVLLDLAEVAYRAIEAKDPRFSILKSYTFYAGHAAESDRNRLEDAAAALVGFDTAETTGGRELAFELLRAALAPPAPDLDEPAEVPDEEPTELEIFYYPCAYCHLPIGGSKNPPGARGMGFSNGARLHGGVCIAAWNAGHRLPEGWEKLGMLVREPTPKLVDEYASIGEAFAQGLADGIEAESGLIRRDSGFILADNVNPDVLKGAPTDIPERVAAEKAAAAKAFRDAERALRSAAKKGKKRR